jgi:hypothetical protein
VRPPPWDEAPEGSRLSYILRWHNDPLAAFREARELKKNFTVKVGHDEILDKWFIHIIGQRPKVAA